MSTAGIRLALAAPARPGQMKGLLRNRTDLGAEQAPHLRPSTHTPPNWPTSPLTMRSNGADGCIGTPFTAAETLVCKNSATKRFPGTTGQIAFLRFCSPE